MRPVLLFLIPLIFLATLTSLGYVLYHATDVQDARNNSPVTN